MILRPITTSLPTERRSRPMGKSHQQMPSRARRAATYHDPRSDELTLSSIFRNKVAVPTLAFHEGRQTQLRHDMVDDRPPSGCEPESDCAAGTLPYSKTAAAQSAVWMKIGQELRACYEVPQDLPPEMLALLMQLNDRREEK
jgi:hypothetical protein